MKAFAAIVLCLTACSSASSSSSAPTTCSRADRSGTYRLTFAEESGGSCGPIPSILVDFNAPAQAGCVLTSGMWSDNDCKFAGDVTCTTANGTIREVEVTREDSAGGASLSGTLTATITQGSQGCASTYEVTAVRQ